VVICVLMLLKLERECVCITESDGGRVTGGREGDTYALLFFESIQLQKVQ
jgi:hypothetical protein